MTASCRSLRSISRPKTSPAWLKRRLGKGKRWLRRCWSRQNHLELHLSGDVARTCGGQSSSERPLQTKERITFSTEFKRMTTTLSCHCGAVQFELAHAPETVTECNCSFCRRVGVLWAYYTADEVRLFTEPLSTTT